MRERKARKWVAGDFYEINTDGSLPLLHIYMCNLYIYIYAEAGRRLVWEATLNMYIYKFLESELVSGFFTEHSAAIFVFFFLAEYGSIVLISILTSILFLGGYLLPFHHFVMSYVENPALEGLIYGVTLGVKTCLLVFTFI